MTVYEFGEKQTNNCLTSSTDGSVGLFRWGLESADYYTIMKGISLFYGNEYSEIHQKLNTGIF